MQPSANQSEVGIRVASPSVAGDTTSTMPDRVATPMEKVKVKNAWTLATSMAPSPWLT